MQAAEAKCTDLTFAVEQKDAELQEQAVELQRALDVSTMQIHIHTRIYIHNMLELELL
jgi:hypothetical protein